MYIEPNTNIKLLTDVPLNNDYNNTLYFSDKSAQLAYFTSKVKHNLTKQTYQRVNKGSMRIGLSSDLCYDCNYLMFQNTSYGSKWFYAFITSVEYINNEVCEIHFEIDDMQTWFYDCTLKECFVEREHSLTDEVGDNILPEPVNVGEYVVSDYKQLTPMGDSKIILAIVDVEGGSKGEFYDGVYGGAELWVYDTDYSSIQAINSKIDSYNEKPNAILSIYMCPAILLQNISSGAKLSYGEGGNITVVTSESLDDSSDFQGYIPKNKKLYTYPYNYFNVDNASGSSLSLRYEFFDDLKPVIQITGTVTQPVKCIARPCSYKGTDSFTPTGGYHTLNTESISLESYPICSWNVDSWSQFVAQQSVPLALKGISNMGALFASESTANSLQAQNQLKTNILGSVTSTLSTLYSASISADVCHGSFNNGGVNFSTNRQQFFKCRMHITKNYCKAIDSFFNCFGYKTNLTKIPNINNRPHWNYVKTTNCIVTGKAPTDSITNICNIFNKGITFWKNGNEVGDYDLDNSPT